MEQEIKSKLSKFEQARYHLTALQRLGYDVRGLFAVVTQREEEAEEGGVPDDLARRYTVPTSAPATQDHLGEGGKPQALRPEVMWAGHHYTLTPGQRQWLRDFAGMTPTETVTIAWVAVWKGTQHPKGFKLVSDLHVDPRLRRHVLTELVVRDAGRFFWEAGELDRAREEVKAEAEEKSGKGRKVTKVSDEDTRTLEKLLKELGAV